MNNYFLYLVPFSSLSLLIWFIISFISFVCTNHYVYVAWNLRSVYRNEPFFFFFEQFKQNDHLIQIRGRAQ